MKKIILTAFAALLIGLSTVTAQGINFESGTWEQALQKAKSEHKLVFVDVFTTWCGPCKKMAAEVFTQDGVGQKFNSSFINYKIDAEKGEGLDIAKTFKVNSFPGYLFVNGDGQLIYRFGGYMEAPKFMQQAEVALLEQNDPKPLATWQMEYNSGMRNKHFLLGYLKKRTAVGLSSAQILEDLFPMLSADDLKNGEIIKSMIFFGMNIAYVPKGKLYEYIVRHNSDIDALLNEQQNHSLEILAMGVRAYFKEEIIPNKTESMLPVMVSANAELMSLMKRDRIEASNKELIMTYYSATHNEAKLKTAAVSFMNDLLKTDFKTLRLQDAESLKKMREPYVNGMKDSTGVDGWSMMNQMVGRASVRDLAFTIRDAAEMVYHGAKNKELLNQALSWAKIAENNLPEFSTKAVYAALLMKTGNKQDAITMMQSASADPVLEMFPELKKLFAENVEKIQSDIEPDQLWHR